MIKLTVTGGAGRMGRAVLRAATADARFQVVGATDRRKSPNLGSDVARLIEAPEMGVILTDDIMKAFEPADVVIDFTAPEGSLLHAAMAAQLGIPIVVGTTGFTDAQRRQLARTAEKVAVVFSPNMSVGVNLFWHISASLALQCGPEYQLAIEETHHVHKLDAPSGTAKQLQALVAEAAGRDAQAIPVVSRREGEVVGDHTITFDSAGDRISITHHAKTRTIFAHGALVAADWIIGKPAGWYGMRDVIRGT